MWAEESSRITMKIHLLVLSVSLSILAPAGCDQPSTAQLQGLDPLAADEVDDLAALEVDAADAADAAVQSGADELMAPMAPSLGQQLCCGTNSNYTWDCSGKTNSKGISDVQACEDSPYCTVGACGSVSLDAQTTLDPGDPGDPGDPIDPPILLGDGPLQY